MSQNTVEAKLSPPKKALLVLVLAGLGLTGAACRAEKTPEQVMFTPQAAPSPTTETVIPPVDTAVTPGPGGAEVQATPTRAIATATPAKDELMTVTFNNLRYAILTIDETAVPWPDVAEQENGIPYHDEATFEGNNIPGRSRETVKTGGDRFAWIGGGRFALRGSVPTGLGVETKGVKPLEGNGFKVVIDPVSGQILYEQKGDKIVIPGGDNDYLRGNIVLVVGIPGDHTATDFEVDTGSNYMEQRLTDELNADPIRYEGLQLLSAMMRVYAKNMYLRGACNGNGCRDGIGVYVVRGGDKTSGRNAHLLFGAVLSPQELGSIHLK